MNTEGPSPATFWTLLREAGSAASRQPRRWMSLWVAAGFVAAVVFAVTHAPPVAWLVLALILLIAAFSGLVLAEETSNSRSVPSAVDGDRAGQEAPEPQDSASSSD